MSKSHAHAQVIWYAVVDVQCRTTLFVQRYQLSFKSIVPDVDRTTDVSPLSLAAESSFFPGRVEAEFDKLATE